MFAGQVFAFGYSKVFLVKLKNILQLSASEGECAEVVFLQEVAKNVYTLSCPKLGIVGRFPSSLLSRVVLQLELFSFEFW